MTFFIENYQEIFAKSMQHLSLSMTALFLGILVAVPLGVMVSRSEKLSKGFVGVTSILQTIPSLALLAMMVPILGVGRVPATVALFIYSLLPILRNTVLGMNSVNPNIVDAAKGMGMTFSQRVFKVQLPLAMDVLMSGIRLSAVYVISWTSLAAYIGAGGLGDFLFQGLSNFNIDSILAGTIPVTILALCVDGLFSIVQKHLEPKMKRVVVE